MCFSLCLLYWIFSRYVNCQSHSSIYNYNYLFILEVYKKKRERKKHQTSNSTLFFSIEEHALAVEKWVCESEHTICNHGKFTYYISMLPLIAACSESGKLVAVLPDKMASRVIICLLCYDQLHCCT